MTKKEFNANKKYLEECNGIFYNGRAYSNKPFSAELESYTCAGGDQIIILEEMNKKCLQEMVDNFNINKEVIAWWPCGEKRDPSVPFNNIKEHYIDLEKWLNLIQKVCNDMPY